MKLTVLGKWGAYPEAGESTAGYLLQTDRHSVLIDCGSGVLSRLFTIISSEKLDGVFISHFHHDHTADLGCLGYASKIAKALQKRQEPLQIFAPAKSNRFLELTQKDHTIGIETKSEEQIDLNGLSVSFKDTVHEEHNLAMRFEYQGKILVYTGDMGPASDLDNFCRGADLLIGETSLYENEEGLFSGHMTSKETALLAEESGVQKLLLTHFPHTGDINRMLSEAAKYFSGEVYLAEIGQEYII